MRKITIDDKQYFARSAFMGYGYVIICRESLPNDKTKDTVLFRSYNRELVSRIMDDFIAGEVVTDFPDVSDEVPPLKILYRVGKHINDFYVASTLEQLKKAATKILKEEYDDAINLKPTEPKNESGINTVEDIETLPTEELKKEVKTRWDKYQKSLKRYKFDLLDWQDLYNTVNDVKGADIVNAMSTYGGNWELVTPREL